MCHRILRVVTLRSGQAARRRCRRGGGPGIDDDRVDQSLAHLLAQPLKVLGAAVVDGTGSLDLDRQDGSIITNND